MWTQIPALVLASRQSNLRYIVTDDHCCVISIGIMAVCSPYILVLEACSSLPLPIFFLVSLLCWFTHLHALSYSHLSNHLFIQKLTLKLSYMVIKTRFKFCPERDCLGPPITSRLGFISVPVENG